MDRGTPTRGTDRQSTLQSYAIRSLAVLGLVVGAIATTLGSRVVPAARGAGLPAFTGTSETTFTLPGLAPAGAARIVKRHRVVADWSVADPGQWWLKIHTLQPALVRSDETVVANGSTLTMYNTMFNRAWKVQSTATLATLATYQAGSIAGTIQGLGQSYFTYLRQQGGNYRLLGQEQIVGRTADVYDIWPLYTGESTRYGRARIWLDRQYSLVLRVELHGLGRYREQPHRFVYRVTSLTMGQGPLPDSLTYRPPVTPRRPPASRSSSGWGAGGGSDTGRLVPKRFIPVGAPRGYTGSGSGQGQDPMWSGPTSAEILFTRASAYVYLQEQVRVKGLPRGLRIGHSQQAGSCRVWTGRYSRSGLRRLALRRGNVSLLLVSNAFSESRLIRYAATKICGP